VENQPKGSDLYNVAVSDSTPVSDAAPVNPGPVPTLEVFDDEPFAFPQNEAMVSGNHGIHQAKVCVLLATDNGLVAHKLLVHFLTVRPDDGQVEHAPPATILEE
jgi:hypothetical protein